MENEIKEILLNLKYVNYTKNFINEKNIRSILIKEDKVEISIELNFPIALLSEEFKVLIKNSLKSQSCSLH